MQPRENMGKSKIQSGDSCSIKGKHMAKKHQSEPYMMDSTEQQLMETEAIEQNDGKSSDSSGKSKKKSLS